MNQQFTISTSKKIELIDITSQVKEIVSQSDISEGICLISFSHSTAAILITENETGLINDWEKFIQKLTEAENWEHNQIDNNAEAHLLSGLIGQSKVLPIKNNQLHRGTWQQIFLVDLDGPRNQRRVNVNISQ